MNERVAVFGGGAAGVVLANELARRGAPVDLLEKAPRLGGLHRSTAAAGMEFDIGAFLFSKEHELFRSFPSLLGSFTRVAPSLASITPKGNIDRYPLSLPGYFRDNGARVGCLSVADFFLSKIRYRGRATVPDFTKYYVGAQVYRRSGLQNYIERLFGMPDHDVDMEFARQRLPEIQAYTPIRVTGRYLRRVRDRLVMGKREPPTTFVRPPAGFDQVYDLIRSDLERGGVTVHLGCDVRSIRKTADGFDVEFGGGVHRYGRVASTIPVPLALRLAGMESHARFDTMAVYSMFYTGRLRHHHTEIYNFMLEGVWKRLTAFSKYYGPHRGRDFWTVEATTRDTSAGILAALRAEFEDHALRFGLCDGTPECVGALVTERAYPVFHRGEFAALEAEKARLTEMGIDHVGRQGAFEYLSSDAAARKARELAKRIGALSEE